MAQSSDTDDVTVIAHRGFAGRYPENTVGAVEGATRGETSADTVEIDVQPTADGTPVVCHDSRLDGREDGGLTDATGVVRETDTATVTGASVLGTTETVPTLADLLSAVPPSVGVNVELKNPGTHDVAPGRRLSAAELADRGDVWRPFTRSVLDIVGEYDNDILFSSFCEAALSTVREQAPSLPVAALCADDIRTGLHVARRYDCEAIHVPLDMVPGTPSFDAERFGDIDVCGVAHDEGRAVNVWTVETWHQARGVAAAGADGIIADYPGLLDFER